MEYLTQRANGYYCCKVIALLNAARFHGKSTIYNSGPAWQELVDFVDCRKGDIECWEPIAARFGLKPVEVSLELDQIQCNLPVMVFLRWHPLMHHTALIVGVDGENVSIANYKGHLSEEQVYERPLSKLDLAQDTGYSLQM